MKIAVCDDSFEFRKELLDRIQQSIPMSEEITFYEFSSSEELLESYDEEIRYDIIFLDVEMAETSGIDAGIRIRTIDKKVIIIFVSNYSKYAIPAYDCEAFYFVVKPVVQKKFENILSKAIEKYKLIHQYYIIKNKSGIRKIPVKDILFIEIYRKHLIFHMINGRYETIGKISDALCQLCQYGFCQVHQGYLVNMNHIKAFTGYDIILDNGEKVMMSVRKKSDVLRIYADYLERTF